MYTSIFIHYHHRHQSQNYHNVFFYLFVVIFLSNLGDFSSITKPR